MGKGQPIRVGLLGVDPDRGWAAVAHVPALRGVGGYRLQAIANRRLDVAQAAAARFGAPLAFGDPLDLVRHPDIDLVVVTARVTGHDHLVRLALDAGKHVYCEWPLGVDLAEARALATLADQAGKYAVIGLQGYCSVGARTVRQLIDQGAIGQLTAVSVSGSGGPHGARTLQAYAYTLDAAAGATILSVSTAHWLAALEVAVGPLRSVAATVLRVRSETVIIETGERLPVTAPDQVALSGELANGALLSVSVHSGVAPGAIGFEARITGTEGSLLIRPAGPGTFHMADWAISLARTDGSVEHLTVPEDNFVQPIPAGPPRNVARIYAALAEALIAGKKPEPSFATAVHFHELVDAIDRAGSSGSRQLLAQGGDSR